jgi:hypothetical protein
MSAAFVLRDFLEADTLHCRAVVEEMFEPAGRLLKRHAQGGQVSALRRLLTPVKRSYATKPAAVRPWCKPSFSNHLNATSIGQWHFGLLETMQV